MIDKDVFIETLLNRVRKLPVGHYLDMRTYKRNRSVLLIREGEDEYLVIEDGFFHDKFRITFDEISRIFKKILKREFPRSHKIRLYTMGLYDKEKAQGIKRKKI